LTTYAKANQPTCVLSHGDNFYWTGVTSTQDKRWTSLFEETYSDPSLFVPWYNVLGNHDLGGGSGFCGASCWNCGTVCDSTQLMLDALKKKVDTQKKYKSGNKNRWVFEGTYYTKKHFFPPNATSDDHAEFSVEIFNIDTNAAGNRLTQTCCQCYSIAAAHLCDNPIVGHPECARGSTATYQACANEITRWWNDAMAKLVADLKRSTATWKIVHQHYLMKHHFSASQIAEVAKILKDYKVHIFIGGHRHGEGHEAYDLTHHIENGGGGGAKAAGGCSGKDCIWGSSTYGFVALKLSKYYMRVEFINDFGDRMHCYHIPVDHSDAYATDRSTWNWC